MDPVIRELHTLGIKNLVCVGELSPNLDLTHLSIAAGLELVEYEPEQFPSLISRGDVSDPVFLSPLVGE
jgi:TATA-box binding protein (TBP) (component of TFIID and TFIIIB)